MISPMVDPFTGLPIIFTAAPECKSQDKNTSLDVALSIPTNLLCVRIRDYYSGDILHVTQCCDGFAPSWGSRFSFTNRRRFAIELLHLDNVNTRTDAMDVGITKIAGCDVFTAHMQNKAGVLNMVSASPDNPLMQSQLKFAVSFTSTDCDWEYVAATCSQTSSWSLSSSDDASVDLTKIPVFTCSATSSESVASSVDNTCSLTSSDSTRDHPSWWWDNSSASDAASTTCSMTSSASDDHMMEMTGQMTVMGAVLAAKDMMPWVQSVNNSVKQLVADGEYDGVEAVINTLNETLRKTACIMAKAT